MDAFKGVLTSEETLDECGVSLLLVAIGYLYTPGVEFPSASIETGALFFSQGGYKAGVIVQNQGLVLGESRFHLAEEDSVKTVRLTLPFGNGDPGPLSDLPNLVLSQGMIQVDSRQAVKGFGHTHPAKGGLDIPAVLLGKGSAQTSEQLLGGFDVLFAAALDSIPLQHRKLGIMMGSGLFIISETVGDLIDASRAPGDELLHKEFRAGDEVELPAAPECAVIGGGKELYVGFRYGGAAETRGLAFYISPAVKKTSHFAI